MSLRFHLALGFGDLKVTGSAGTRTGQACVEFVPTLKDTLPGSTYVSIRHSGTAVRFPLIPPGGPPRRPATAETPAPGGPV